MKIRLRPVAQHSEGYVLLLTVVFGAVTLTVLAGALNWSADNLRLNTRNNQYFRTLAAAEAATEAVVSQLTFDYQAGGDALIQSRVADYRLVVPTGAQHSYWDNYVFGNDLGQTEQTRVEFVSPVEYRELSSQYRGLSGYASIYRVLSTAREKNGLFAVRAGVQQDIEPATVPLFQFAIFYNMDLEINPGPNMTIAGPVHSNGTIYAEPQANLTFQNDVTAVGNIIHAKKPGDPSSRTLGTINYLEDHEGGVTSLNLPIGTNNTPSVVRQVVELPPTGELPSSPMGKQRFYNQADLVIKVTDSGVVATSGSVNNFATTIPSSQVSQFVDTTPSFFNKRENKTIKTTQIDVAKLRSWNATNTVLRPVVPFGDVRIVYVIDQRSQTGGTESGVRLVNGEDLLPRGLTVATPNPLYVVGDYNSRPPYSGTADTSAALPAALIGDAITVLSKLWKDADSTKSLNTYRKAKDTTVNAAFLAGIVSTVSGSYSGGVENFPRFLEDWSGKTFTYNGSMVVMFESVYATGEWGGTGSSINIYNPPTRNWSFDVNFRDPAKIPPGTPAAKVLVRAAWRTVQPTVAIP